MSGDRHARWAITVRGMEAASGMTAGGPNATEAVGRRSRGTQRCRTPGRRAALAAALALVAAACAPRTAPPAPVTGGPVEARPLRHRHAIPRPEHKPSVPPPVALNEPAPTAPSVQALVGLDQTTTIERLGPPTAIDSRPPAKVWRYKAATCELDLYFYLDLRSGQMRTLHYAFKGDADDNAKQEQCLRAIGAARRASLGG